MSRIVKAIIMCSTVFSSLVLGCDSDDENVEFYPKESSDCVDSINTYRETLALPPYDRWTAGETCASKQAKQDAKSGEYHGSFGQCDAMAQNECAGSEPIASMLDECLQAMWDEGPGEDFDLHGHYLNMSSTEFTEVACGFYITSSGEVWSVQNFR